ncbi:MAG TPA: 16S rRNA (adenine(1518)-N(6)/adenine(1519)-N(6))-dimethyltransferase RsmA [Dehalococcoidia bacterium]|nr:16S rRNA (adenine(1518)-N(6)/adenine(1519)-N(6))-dimethyltransferase RsmA [Dehalococcoidia bacterium]
MDASSVVSSRGGRPRKSLGQHWLTDHRYLRRIARAVATQPETTLIEVGPGRGALTSLLARLGKRLIGVEVDQALFLKLSERFKDRKDVSLINADILTLWPADLLKAEGASPPYIVTGNLPYFIGTAIIRHFLRADPPPTRMIVTLQKEVAQSIVAAPGQMTYLSVEMQYFSEPRLLFEIPPQAFRPPPKVDSAVVRLEVRQQRQLARELEDSFLGFVQAGFAARRKRLRNSLAIGLREETQNVERLLEKAGIDATLRAQSLPVEDWIRLYTTYRHSASPTAQ